jgi:hemerythrin-like domain-containing protein
MSDFIPLGRMLHEEHVRTLALMNALDSRTTGGSGKRPVDPADPHDRQLLEEAVAAIHEEVKQHFGFEESALFPLIADRGAGDMTRLLTQEHAVISPLGRRLSKAIVGALKSGFDDPGWSEFREVAQELVDRVTFHLQKEEMGIIQRRPSFFASETDRRLADQYGERRMG